jgi:hypothetical protein
VNFKRPQNIPRILDALRGQSHPCSITLIDCAPSPEFEAKIRPDQCDRYLRFRENHGAYNRMLGGFVYEREFTYFHDDDMLPGERVIEHFVGHARGHDFAVLGQFGRMFPADLKRYSQDEIPRLARSLNPVDMIVRAYFVRSRNLHHVLRLKWALPSSEIKEDDMMLACSMRMYAGLQCYLTPVSDDHETLVCKESLYAGGAFAGRANHMELRAKALREIVAAGWPEPV